MVATGIIALLWAWTPPVVVLGTAACPTPAAVAARLADLMPPAATAREDDRVELSKEDGGLAVRLRRQGAVVAVRALERATCRDLAQSAAVVVAAWYAQLGDGETGVGEPPAAATERPPAVTARPTETIANRVSAAPASRPSGSAFVSAGGFAAFDGGAFAPALRLGLLSVRPAGGAGVATNPAGFALGLTAGWTAARSSPLGGGTGRWSRLDAAVTLGWRFGLGERTALDAGLALAASLLRTEGTGFDDNTGATTLHPGAGAHLHLARRMGRVMPWLGVDLFVWPRRQELYVEGSPARLVLPRVDVLVGGGLALPL